MLAAAWLHDTVEDTGVTIELIENEFGQVADHRGEQNVDRRGIKSNRGWNGGGHGIQVTLYQDN